MARETPGLTDHEIQAQKVYLKQAQKVYLKQGLRVYSKWVETGPPAPMAVIAPSIVRPVQT